MTPTKADSTVQGKQDGGMITTSFPAHNTDAAADAFARGYARASTSSLKCGLGVTNSKLVGYYLISESAGVARQRYVLLTQKAVSQLGEPAEEDVVVGNTSNRVRRSTHPRPKPATTTGLKNFTIT